MPTVYTTHAEAVEREIIAAIEAGDATRDEFDVDAIAQQLVIETPRGYHIEDDDEDHFWTIVMDNMK